MSSSQKQCVICIRIPSVTSQQTDKTRDRVFELYTFRLAVLAAMILYIGLKVEQWNVNRLPDSAYLYETEQVCGLYPPTEYARDFLSKPIFASVELAVPSNVSKADVPLLSIKKNQIRDDDTFEHQDRSSMLYPQLASSTHASAEIVRSNAGIVQHCGNCGQCSNPHDVAIYDDTRNTLFQSTLHCSYRALVLGRQSVTDCMQQSVGFTDKCNDCWVDNIMCDARNCLFTCAWTTLVSRIKKQSSTEDDPQQLNACLQCDEKRCGPAFLQCAGANRRRAGILSDIQRNANQLCQAVDEEWWKSESLQSYYKLTLEQ